GVSYKMVHSLSEIWSAAATPPVWLSSQLTVGKEHPLVRPAQPKAKAPPLAAHSKWHRLISRMTHYQKIFIIPVIRGRSFQPPITGIRRIRGQVWGEHPSRRPAYRPLVARVREAGPSALLPDPGHARRAEPACRLCRSRRC